MRRSVVHVVSSVGFADGVSIATKTMLEGLSERTDWQAEAIVGDFPQSDRSFAPTNVSITSLRGFQLFGGKLGPSASYGRGFVSAMTNAASGCDLFHLHNMWLYPTLVGSRLARRLGIPYVVSPHGALMPVALRRRSWKKSLVFGLLERSNLQHAASIVATSDRERGALQQLGIRAPVVVIPHALSSRASAFFQSHTRQLTDRASSRQKVLLTVSRYHPIKRLLELIELFSQLGERHPDWRLLIVGSRDDPEYRSRVLRKARASPSLANRIGIMEDVVGPDLWSLYEASDAFVLPSLTENFGLVVLEALAAGIPVVATRGSPWHELEENGCGWWTGTSLGSLMDTLDHVMSLELDELTAIGSRGQDLVARRYSSAAQAAALAALYDMVIESGAR